MRPAPMLPFVLVTALVISTLPSNASAYESYHDPSLDDQGYCASCHPGFGGGLFDTLHYLHVGGGNEVTLNCNLCHTGTTRDNPLTMWSTGNAGDGLGCAGCHGRDYGEAIWADYSGLPSAGLPKNSGFGLRLHHFNAGVTFCGSCHSGDQTPAPENVLYPMGPGSSIEHYYDRFDVHLNGGVVDMCENEDSANDVDSLGLDNDGDWDYEGADTDCGASTPVATPTPTPTSTTIPTETPLSTATLTPTPTPTPAVVTDHYVVYKAKASSNAAKFPSNDYNLQFDDIRLDNTEPDDPENYWVKKEKSLAVPAMKNDEIGPSQPALHYIRYQIKEAKEGAGAFSNGYPQAVKHEKRIWELENQFGTLKVETKKVEALLVPAAKDLASTPPAPANATHYICYQAKPTKDVTDQTPDTGSGKGKFRKDLEAFFGDQFLDIDCATDRNGSVSFAGTPVEGKCLFNLKKVKALCNPVIKSDVGGVPPRVTIAPAGSDSTPVLTESLLCYQPKLSSKILSSAAAALAGAPLGTGLKQSKHVKRSPHTQPGNQFPAPLQVDTKKTELICVPTKVILESPVDPGDPVLPAAVGYVGSDTCRECHEQKFDGWATTLHRMPLRNTDAPGLTGKAVVADSDGDGTDDFKVGTDLGTALNATAFAVYGSNAPVLGFDPIRTDPNSGALGVYTITIGPVTYDITRTHGGHGYWKQRYQTRIGDSYYYLPVQYNEVANEYVAYHPERWYDGGNLPLLTNPATVGDDVDKTKSYELKCAGCHNTGVDVEVDGAGQYVTGYVELGIGCEQCHGPGATHAASMNPDDIVNPGEAGVCDGDTTPADGNKDGTCRETGVPCDAQVAFPANAADCLAAADQVCGSCHNRGASTLVLGGQALGYPGKDDGFGAFQGYRPGDVLDEFYDVTTGTSSYWGYEQVYIHDHDHDDFGLGFVTSRKHHQQYLDMQIGPHAPNNFFDPTCFSCHTSHGSTNEHSIVDSLDEDGTIVPTQVDDNSLCLACHATHGAFADITPVQVAQIGTGTTPVEVEDAVLEHMAEEAGMGGAYNPEGTGVGRCTGCHMPKLAKSAIYGTDAEGHTTGDISSHTFNIIWPSVNEHLTGGDETMTNSCTACHNTTLPLGMDDELFEWAKSGHADVTARHWRYSAGADRAACVECHSANGFVDLLAGIPEGDRRTEPKMVTCYACHDGQPSDLHAVRAVPSVTFPSGEVVTEGGNSAICMNCHSARKSTDDVDAYLLTHPDPDPISFGSVNPHYLPAAAMFFGTQVRGGYEYLGQTYIGRTPHQPFKGYCVDCHLGTTLGADEVGGHTFAMAHNGQENTDGCVACHNPAVQPSLANFRNPFAAAVDYDGDLDTVEGIQGEVQTMLDDLAAAIGAAGVTCTSSYPYCSGWNGTTAQQQSQLQAAYNLRFIGAEPGAFAHNGLYALQLLHDSYADLTGGAHAGIRPM